MCLGEYFRIKEIQIQENCKDTDKFKDKKSFIVNNRNQYLDIKDTILKINVTNVNPININNKFSELFAIYNISIIFDDINLKNKVDGRIADRFITTYQLKFLLLEYIRIYEDFVFFNLL